MSSAEVVSECIRRLEAIVQEELEEARSARVAEVCEELLLALTAEHETREHIKALFSQVFAA